MSKCLLLRNTIQMCNALAKTAKINTYAEPNTTGLYYTQFYKFMSSEFSIATVAIDTFICDFCPFCGEKIYNGKTIP